MKSKALTSALSPNEYHTADLNSPSDHGTSRTGCSAVCSLDCAPGAEMRLLASRADDDRADLVEHHHRIEKLLPGQPGQVGGLVTDSFNFAAELFAGFHAQLDLLPGLLF